MTTKTQIGFIGAGNMAQALIGGLIKSEFSAENIYATDLDTEKLNQLCSQFQIRSSESNQVLVEQCDVIVLAVKPQVLQQVIRDIDCQGKAPLFISIAAGITTTAMNNWFTTSEQTNPSHQPIVRTMPNTPALVQSGVTGLFATTTVTDQQKTLADKIMAAVGETIWVAEEKLLDTITALSGSGPAYFFYFMQAMSDAGKDLGLDEATSQRICIQTALGAAKLALQSDDSLEELRKRVTSPGGTTERALEVLQSKNSKTIISDAVHAAHDRAGELAKQLEN